MRKKWSKKSKDLIKELHRELVLNNENWHQLKSDKDRRSAELLVSALSQIVNEGEQQYIEELLMQSVRWIKGEVSDPGCPHR